MCYSNEWSGCGWDSGARSQRLHRHGPGWYDRFMTARGYTLFDTPIGRCGIAWNERGISGFQLPEDRDDDTRSRLLKRLPDYTEATPTGEAQLAIESIIALLNGEGTDL